MVRPRAPFQSSSGFESAVVTFRFGSLAESLVSSSWAKISFLLRHPNMTWTF